MPPAPHAECVAAVREHLCARALEHYALADRLNARKATRGNAKVARRMAVAFAWSAGQLRDLVTR